MTNRLVQLTLVVRDYDEAIDFYARALGFTLLEDTSLGGGKRWVRVGPCGAVAALEDLYGNKWDLVQRRAPRVS